MATYLDGVEDGRRDMLIRIEREAIAHYRDMRANPGQRGLSLHKGYAKLDTLVNLIRNLSDGPVSWQDVYDRVTAKAVQLDQQRVSDLAAASAKVVS